MATNEVVTPPVGGEEEPRPGETPEGKIAWRYVNGRRVHPSWPPGYIEWLDEMRETGELDLGDPDELRRAFNDPRAG